MYIFVASPGRSGTKFLSELFGSITQIPSFHTPAPECAGRDMWDFNNGVDIDRRLNEKVESIKKKARDGDYFESAPTFIKCFGEKITEEFKDHAVIHLFRDPLFVAKSFSNRSSGPDEGNLHRWRLSMHGKKNILQISGNKLTLYQKNLWEWLEVELRYDKFKETYKKTFDLSFQDINGCRSYEGMLNHFGIVYDRNKLTDILKNNKLSRNTNKIRTVVTDEDMAQAKDFIKKLKNIDFDRNVFSQNIYKDFAFTGWLREGM
jgi:hypothetical protein